ncbi:MAG: glycosyltransferase family 39 protein [bacterium]|nr:glycosyltransferase family 39 protein [bacterium]
MKRLRLPEKFWGSDYMIMVYFALFNFILHLAAIKGFGFFRDEYYYIACSENLSFGYVDHPPLAMALLKVVRMLFGNSLIAIRMVPALLGAAVVFLTGLLAKEMGGKKLAIALASAASLATVANFFIFHYYSMNSPDHLFWIGCFLIIIRLIKTGNQKYWLLLGTVAGLGLQNKISILFLVFGLFAGMLFTKEWAGTPKTYPGVQAGTDESHSGKWAFITSVFKRFSNKYLWLGAAIAGLLFLPYVIWNIVNGMPTLEFIHNAKTVKMATVGPLEFLLKQILMHNIFILLIWLPGLWYLFFNKEGKQFRLFGWMYLSIYILFTFQQAKFYYLTPIYPILLAAGAVFIGQKFAAKKWPVPLLIVVIVVPALIFCPVLLPILPLDTTMKVATSLGMSENNPAGENHKMGVLPQHYADMFGWEGMVDKVAGVYNSLSPKEQEQCILFGSNYGVAGALDYHGKPKGLPPAISGHNGYYYNSTPNPAPNVLIAVGGPYEVLKEMYEEVTEVDRTQCDLCMPYENNKPIYLCKNLKVTFDEIWPKFKYSM